MSAIDRTWVLTTCSGRAAQLAQMLPAWVSAFEARVLVVCCQDPDAIGVAHEARADWIRRRGAHFHAGRARNFALATGARRARKIERPLALLVDCDTSLRDVRALAEWLERVDHVGIGWLGRGPSGFHPPGLAGLVATTFGLARAVGGYPEMLGYGFEDLAFRRRLIARARIEPAWLDPEAVGHLHHSHAMRRSRYERVGGKRRARIEWFARERVGLESIPPAELVRHTGYRPPLFNWG